MRPAGSVVEMVTPGSGGFGDPGKREPSAIGEDLLDEYVTPAAVQEAYAIDDPGRTLLAKAKRDDEA